MSFSILVLSGALLIFGLALVVMVVLPAVAALVVAMSWGVRLLFFGAVPGALLSVIGGVMGAFIDVTLKQDDYYVFQMGQYGLLVGIVIGTAFFLYEVRHDGDGSDTLDEG